MSHTATWPVPIVFACALAAWATAPAAADVWRLDPEHTEIRVSWDHVGLSRQSGEFRDFYGTLEFTPTAPEAGQVEVSVAVDGIATGVAQIDAALKSVDFFDAARFARITFKSTRILATGDKTGLVIGDLTIRDVTREVTLDTTWNFTGEHPLASFNSVYAGTWVSGFSARASVLRSTFGIDRATRLVSDEIAITIEAEFLRETPLETPRDTPRETP